jgi:hypothetical protein
LNLESILTATKIFGRVAVVVALSSVDQKTVKRRKERMMNKALILLSIATQTRGFIPNAASSFICNPVKIKPTTITPSNFRSNPLSPPCSRWQSDETDSSLFVADLPESTLIGDDSAAFSLEGQVSR